MPSVWRRIRVTSCGSQQLISSSISTNEVLARSLWVQQKSIVEGKKMATFGAGGATLGASIPNRCSLNTATKQPICSVSIKRGRGGANSVIGSLRFSRPRSSPSRNFTIMAASATEIEKAGVKIVRNPPESKLSELGVRSWAKWGCPPSKFPWTYSATETCYLLEGKVKVYPDGSDEAVEIGAGDLVIFPKGMSCTWDVSEAVDKHYKFD